MSANHPFLSQECATPFKCGGCTGDAWDDVKQDLVPCEHYCHGRSDDFVPIPDYPPDNDLFTWAEKNWGPDVEAQPVVWEKELVGV